MILPEQMSGGWILWWSLSLSNPAQRIPKVTECYQQKQVGPSKITGLIQENHLQESNEIWGLCKLFCEIHSGNEGILGLLGGRSSQGWLINTNQLLPSVVIYDTYRTSPWFEKKSVILHWLVVEPYPSQKWWSSSVGMMTFPNWMESHKIHVPNHQPV